jgi:hypothetical protein
MGESWSDLDSTEYLMEYGYVPVDGENPTAVGAFATGEPEAGIRNYALDTNPLNYSDVGYDVAGVEPHSDTDPATALPDTFEMVPGTYRFTARGNGSERSTSRPTSSPDRSVTCK